MMVPSIQTLMHICIYIYKALCKKNTNRHILVYRYNDLMLTQCRLRDCSGSRYIETAVEVLIERLRVSTLISQKINSLFFKCLPLILEVKTTFL